ncbi:MAG TPA: FAD-dependent oxidoreductase [Tepidisphaeraceae bacterium]|nr:FAD-dependent oxidoreductase [Tepidisphaeraceae bacterium]
MTRPTRRLVLSALALVALVLPSGAGAQPAATQSYDVVIVGGTPGGIMTAIGAARLGKTAVILERTEHVGGLPSNGLGATDIATRGATGGLFTEFVGRNYKHYVDTYGPTSQQVKDSSNGYHFEPSIAEKTFHAMLAEHPKITVLKMRQFDAKAENVTLDGTKVTKIRVTHRPDGKVEEYAGKIFVDATYEGDLGAAAGAPFRTRREGKKEYNEPLAGKVYKAWRTQPDELGEGSTGEGDDTIQAFNFRICLTTRADNMVKVEKPANYNRDEFKSIIEDVKLDRWATKTGKAGGEMETPNGIGRIVNMVKLPNGKTDANNQHAAFVSTDLPEENYPWPTADWAWRDKFAQRLREYNLGLIWFVQNDPELPADFRANCAKWGLAKDEYTDNGNFPRQVYVREGRRIEGEYLFTAHDALPKVKGGRTPIHTDSITASHYALDSHAHHKREPGKVHLDGFLSHPTSVYTVPYGVMVPKKIDNLLTPVPVSGTHIGFSTLRMEPCWMALGQAAGVAAAVSIDDNTTPRAADVKKIQSELLKQGAILMHFTDAKPDHKHYAALQKAAMAGLIGEGGYASGIDKPVAKGEPEKWAEKLGLKGELKYEAGKTTRGEVFEALFK